MLEERRDSLETRRLTRDTSDEEEHELQAQRRESGSFNWPLIIVWIALIGALFSAALIGYYSRNHRHRLASTQLAFPPIDKPMQPPMQPLSLSWYQKEGMRERDPLVTISSAALSTNSSRRLLEQPAAQPQCAPLNGRCTEGGPPCCGRGVCSHSRQAKPPFTRATCRRRLQPLVRDGGPPPQLRGQLALVPGQAAGSRRALQQLR